MKSLFNRHSLILVVGGHAPYVRAVARVIKNTFKNDAIVFHGQVQPPIQVLVDLTKSSDAGLRVNPRTVIVCLPKHAVDENILSEIRERGGLIAWACKSHLLKASDLFIGHV